MFTCVKILMNYITSLVDGDNLLQTVLLEMTVSFKHTFKNFNSFNKPNPMQLTHGAHPRSPYI